MIQQTELIVTQWDVNSLFIRLPFTFAKELIVTQWDVNIKDWVYWFFTFGINSYIVGCKFIKNNIQDYRYVELIVTQWDVNDTWRKKRW